MEILTATIVGVVITVLFATIFMQLQHLREDMRAIDQKFTGGLRDIDQKFTGGLNDQGVRVDGILDLLRSQGERLARIEAKLDIDPPTEAA